MSENGHIVYSSYNTLYGHTPSGSGLATLKSFIFSVTPCIPDVIFGTRSHVLRRFKKQAQAKAYKEANSQMCVRIIAFNRKRVMLYLRLKVLSMGRQKAVIKARHEAKRVLRRDFRSHKQHQIRISHVIDGRSRSRRYGAR